MKCEMPDLIPVWHVDKKTPKRLTPSGFSLETLLQIKTVVSVENFLNKNFRLAIKGLVQNC